MPKKDSKGIGRRYFEGVRVKDPVTGKCCWKLTIDGKDCNICDLVADLTPEELCTAMGAMTGGLFEPTDLIPVIKADGSCEKVSLPTFCGMLGDIDDNGLGAVTGDKVVVLNADGTCEIKELNYTIDINTSIFTYDPDTYDLTITETDGSTHVVNLSALLCCTIINDHTTDPCPDPLPTAPSPVPNPLPAAGVTVIEPYDGCTLYFTLNPDGTWAVVTKEDCCVEVNEIQDADLTTAGDPDSGISTYVANNSITNEYIYYIGDGTAEDPDYTWYVDHTGAVINTESPDKCCPITTEIPATAFADPENPTEAEINTYLTTNNITDPGIIIFAGNGTTEDPDYVWNVDSNGTVTNIESPDSDSTHVVTEIDAPCPDPLPTAPTTVTGDEVAGSTVTEVYNGCTLTFTVDADGNWTLSANECRINHAIHGEFCYVGEEEICDCTNETLIFREDFETPSDDDATAVAPSGLGTWNTDFDLAVNGAPYWNQLYAEGIYKVMSAGAVPVANGGAQPDIHSNWLDYAPFATGYAGFNLQPSTGSAGQRIFYRDIDVEEGFCYSLKIKVKDTHSQEEIDAGGIDLADIGMVVNGQVVDNTGPIGPGVQTDDGNVYTISWIADTTGTVEIAFISNNAATNGNDIFINWTEVVKSGTKPETLKGAYRYQLDCDGAIDTSVPPVPVDSEGIELVDPEIVDCPRVVEKTEFNTIIADLQGDIQGGVGSTSSITKSTGIDGEETFVHDDGNGNTETWCTGVVLKDEDGRTTLLGCTEKVLHRTLHIDNLHGGSVGPDDIMVSGQDSNQGEILNVSTRHDAAVNGVEDATITTSGARASVINGGLNTEIQREFSTINGGQDILTNSYASGSVGGREITLPKNAYQFAGGGRNNLSEALYGFTIGGQNNTLTSTGGSTSHRSGQLGGFGNNIIDSQYSLTAVDVDSVIDTSYMCTDIGSIRSYIKSVYSGITASSDSTIDVYTGGAGAGSRLSNGFIAASRTATLKSRQSAIIGSTGGSLIDGDSENAWASVILGTSTGTIRNTRYGFIQGASGALIDGSQQGSQAGTGQSQRSILSSGSAANNNNSKILRGNNSSIIGGSAIDGLGITIDIRNNPNAPYLATVDSLWDYGSVILGGTNGKMYGQQSVLLGGRGLISASLAQVVMGHNNIEQGTSRTEGGGPVVDNTDHVFIIGNGSIAPGAQARDDAFTISWQGDVGMFSNGGAAPTAPPVDPTKGVQRVVGDNLYFWKPVTGTWVLVA